MRRVFLSVGLAAFSAFAILVACTGDDPDTTPASSTSTSSGGSSSGGGSSGNTSSSGGSSSGNTSSSGGSSSGDAGSDAPVDAGYDVRSLKNLKLWLESTKELNAGAGGGAPLGQWFDQSGAWDASVDGAPAGGRHVVEPSDENAGPPGILTNGINGRPSLSFIAGNSYALLDNHSDWQFGLGDFVIVQVAKVVSGAGSLWLLKPMLSNGVNQDLQPTKFCANFASASPSTECTPAFATPTGAHVFAARRKGDIFTFRVDGMVQGTLDRSSNPPNLNIKNVPYVFLGNDLTMQLSEIIVLVGPTADADLAVLEAHLKAKYGL